MDFDTLISNLTHPLVLAGLILIIIAVIARVLTKKTASTNKGTWSYGLFALAFLAIIAGFILSSKPATQDAILPTPPPVNNIAPVEMATVEKEQDKGQDVAPPVEEKVEENKKNKSNNKKEEKKAVARPSLIGDGSFAANIIDPKKRYSLKEYKKAIIQLEKTLAAKESALDKNHPDIVRSYNNLGGAWYSLGDYKKAVEFLEKALSIKENTLSKNHPDIARSYNNLGIAWYSLGSYKKALEYHKKALSIREATLGKNNPDIAASYNNMGAAWEGMGNKDQAKSAYEKALGIYEAALGKDHPNTLKVRKNLKAI